MGSDITQMNLNQFNFLPFISIASRDESDLVDFGLATNEHVPCEIDPSTCSKDSLIEGSTEQFFNATFRVNHDGLFSYYKYHFCKEEDLNFNENIRIKYGP